MSLSVANIEYPITNIPPIHFICDYEYFTEANHCIKSVSALWAMIFRVIRDQWKCHYIWNDHSLDSIRESWRSHFNDFLKGVNMESSKSHMEISNKIIVR